MKIAFVAALITAFATSPAFAQGTPSDPLYFGIKAGRVDIDVSPFDSASNFGGYVGYLLSQDQNGSLFLEGEYTRSFNDGSVGAGEWDMETLAAYVGYRTAGPWFLKAKAGYGWYDVNIVNVAPGLGFDGSETNFTFGAGGGFRLDNNSGVELEYAYIDEDVNSLMLGFFTRF